jgi:hypothetical protein
MMTQHLRVVRDTDHPADPAPARTPPPGDGASATPTGSGSPRVQWAHCLLMPSRCRDLVTVVGSAAVIAGAGVGVLTLLHGSAFFVGVGVLSALGLAVVDDAISRLRFWWHYRRCPICQQRRAQDITALAQLTGVLR